LALSPRGSGILVIPSSYHTLVELMIWLVLIVMLCFVMFALGMLVYYWASEAYNRFFGD
jgi:amino acid transporter